MKPAETKALYESACRSKRIQPQQEEGEKWHKVLREFEARDVKAGLDAWWASRDVDSKGELKCKWLPEPAELKALVESAVRKRKVAQSEPVVLTAWECPSCRATISAFIPVGNQNRRCCPRCAAVMREVHRERVA